MKFFVSYSCSVQDKVREIVASLRDSGEEVWWDQDLKAGQDWWGTILNNIEACEVCLFMISEKSVQSPYCMEELRYALDRNRLVLPYVMDAPVTYTIPPEIMQGRIQFELYSGTPNQLKHRIRVACQGVDWTQYRNRYCARPAEPNTGTNDLVDRLDKAAALAHEGHFDEAIKGFRDVERNDPDSYGEFCHTWIDKIKRYQDVVKHANSPALKSLAKQRWDAFLQAYANDDLFDPLNVSGKLAGADAPAKRTGLLAALSAQPETPAPAVQELTAEEYLQRGLGLPIQNYALKIADFTEAIRLKPDYYEAYYMRGYTYDEKRDYDRAIADYTEAIRLNPMNAAVYLNRGASYEAKGEYDRSIADYTEALRLNPLNAAAYCSRGANYSEIGEHDQAIADYTAALRIDPRYVAAYNNRGNSYDAKGYVDRAIADYDEAIRLNPQYADAYNNRGNSYESKGDVERAIADYNEAIRLNPQYAAAYNNRGVSYYTKQDYDRAIADYDAVLRIDPEHELAKKNRQVALLAKRTRDGQ